VPDLDATQRLLPGHPQYGHLPAEVLAECPQDARGGILEADGLGQYAVNGMLGYNVLVARLLLPPPVRQRAGEPPARVEEALETFSCLCGLEAGSALAGTRLRQFLFQAALPRRLGFRRSRCSSPTFAYQGL
jgi:hypothetical protein